ncbi:hypothetical protein IT570_05675 [Candidatus Sumerlaeota bacterium]|nr:hypothetical protein [Candidatus Sumerlaeota bacterium]
MDQQPNSSDKQSGVAAPESPVLRRALELTRKTRLRPFSMEEMLSRIPDDWQPGEADVDEFLNSIRGRSERR